MWWKSGYRLAHWTLDLSSHLQWHSNPDSWNGISVSCFILTFLKDTGTLHWSYTLYVRILTNFYSQELQNEGLQVTFDFQIHIIWPGQVLKVYLVPTFKYLKVTYTSMCCTNVMENIWDLAILVHFSWKCGWLRLSSSLTPSHRASSCFPSHHCLCHSLSLTPPSHSFTLSGPCGHLIC